MPHALVIELAQNALLQTLLLSAPMMLIAMVVGLLISVVQAVTQIQEQTLSFVPKLFAVGGVFLITLPWQIQIMVKYTSEIFRSIPLLVQ